MLIVGAGGFAKEVLEILHQNKGSDNVVFYDDVSANVGVDLYGQFPVLKNEQQARDYFDKIDNHYTIGVGSPLLRKKLQEKFDRLGGELSSTISGRSMIGSFDVVIGKGCNILDGATISNSVTIGMGCIIYYHSIITHDCIIGNYVEISPGVRVLGRASIGDFSQIGSGATILPRISIGSNVVIGAGTIVTKDIPDNCTVVGIPGRIIKKNT